MFISAPEPQMVIYGPPNDSDPEQIGTYLLYPNFPHHQLHLKLQLGGMTSNGFNEWYGRPKPHASVPDDDIYDGPGDSSFSFEDPSIPSFVGISSALGGYPAIHHQQNGSAVSHNAPGRDFPLSRPFTSRQVPNIDGFWSSSEMNGGMPNTLQGHPSWDHQYQSNLPYHYGNPGMADGLPSGLPNLNMSLGMAHGHPGADTRLDDMTESVDFPAASQSPVYGSFSSTSVSDSMCSASLTDNANLSPWTSAARHSGLVRPCQEIVTKEGTWDVHADRQYRETTVSPKMLKLAPTPTPPSSSSESVHTSFLSLTKAEAVKYEPHPSAIPNQQSRFQKNRRPLPNRSPRQDFVPILPKDPSSRSHASLNTQARHSNSPNPPAGGSGSRQMKTKSSTKSGKAPKHKSATTNSQPATLNANASAHDRARRNDFLLQHKRAGLSYREIREIGGFTEVESTLRGRFRTLTKKKEERVRKPEFQEKDDRLLKMAVRKFAKDSDRSKTKIPWKKVAEDMVASGGSYHFGNATCRKRWDVLNAQEQVGGRGG